MTISLIIWSSLSLAAFDSSYDDLGYVDLSGTSECVATFDRGRIEIRQAFNEADKSLSDVLVLTGQPTRPLPIGSRMWVKSTWGVAWRALVVEAKPGQVKFVVNGRFVGDLFADEIMGIALYDRNDRVTIRDAVLVDLAYDTTDFRKKLADMRDCGDSLGI